MTTRKGRIPQDQISLKEAAKLLGRSEIYIYRLVQRMKIPFYKDGRLLRFDSKQLLEWAAQFYVEPEQNP